MAECELLSCLSSSSPASLVRCSSRKLCYAGSASSALHRCPEEVASPSISRNQVTRIQGTSDYLQNRSSNHSQNNQFYFVPNSNNMFPHHPNTNNFGLDVRLHSANGKVPCQNVLQAQRQDFLSYGFPENQLPWQGSVQGSGEQQLGGIGSGAGFPDVRSLQQQQSSHFQQEPHEVHWQFIEQQHGQELDHSREQNMQQVAHVEFPETSYSALLHGPDTPPSRPEPAWDTPVAGMENCSAAEGFSWPLKGVTGTHDLPNDSCMEGEQGFLYGRRVDPAPSGTQGFFPEQIRHELKVPSKMCPEPQTSNLEDVEVKNQVVLNPVGGSNIQQSGAHFTERDQVSRSLYQMNHQQGFHDSGLSQQRFLDRKWDGHKHSSSLLLEGKNGSLASNGQSFMQLQQRVTSTDLERQDVNCSQFQSRDGLAEESSFKQQEGRALPFREMPTGATPNGIDLQQYNPWNAPQTQSMNGAYGNHLQPPADAGYNSWSWQEGHHFMQHTSGLSYDSGSMQMGPNHAQYGWGTQSAATMADAFSRFYPEGYYSSGSSRVASFGGVGENDVALPPPFEPYGHYQGSQVYHPPANQFVPGVGMPVKGTGCNSNWNKFSGPEDIASQKNHERLVHAGGQVQPRQLQSNRIKGPHVGQPTNNFAKSRQEKTFKSGLDGSADKETSLHEKNVELEGPQVKKQRDFSEVNVGGYNLRSSSKSSPQPRPGSSSNLPVNLREDGTSSRRNISHVQDMESTFHSSGSIENDHNVQAVSHGSGFESGMDQEGHTSEEVLRVFQRSDTPSNFSPSLTRDATRAQVTSSFMSEQMMNRDLTRSGASTSAVCENGVGFHRRDFIPGVRFVPSAEQLQEHSTNNDYFPRGPHTGFREDIFSTGRNLNEKGYDRSSISITQDQLLVDPLMRQLGEQVGWENVSSETGMSSYAGTPELPESQCNIMKPSNAGGGPGSISMSSMRKQDVRDEHNVYCNPSHDYSSSVDGGEYIIPNLHPEVQEQRTSYPLSGVHPSHSQQFAYLKAVPSETSAQLRGFSRSALGKFHPPPPFQSHPVHLQRENGRLTDTCFEEQTPSEAWAPRIFESGVLANGKKEMVPKPVNYQANSGFMGKGPFYFPATGESVAMMKSMFLSESEGMQQQGLSSSEAGSVSKQQPADTLLYAHTQPPGQIVANNIGRGIHSRSMTVESQGSARPLYRLRDNEQLKALQPSVYPEPMASGSNLVELMQVGGEQHQPGHYTGHHTFGEEYSAFRDGVSTIPGKIASERLSQHQLLASKPNLRAPTTLHPKKRKKPVPYLVPWHIVTTQPRGQLPSLSKAELMWASAANRIPEKDGGEVPNIGTFRAESRLRLTTQLMQQLLSPLPSVLMHGNQPVNLECGIYNLAKSALGEACRLMGGTERETDPTQKDTDIKAMASHGPKRMWNLAKEVGLVERFMEKVKRLDFERARLDCSMSVLELKAKNHDLEKSLIVHRLGKHHGTDFLIESKLLEPITNCGPGIRRLPPQKYVIAVPMPRTLPEGVRCLSL